MVSDTILGGLVTFPAKSNIDSSELMPTYVKIEGAPLNWTPIADGLYMPAKYASKVASWSYDGLGIVLVGISTVGTRQSTQAVPIPGKEVLGSGVACQQALCTSCSRSILSKKLFRQSITLLKGQISLS